MPLRSLAWLLVPRILPWPAPLSPVPAQPQGREVQAALCRGLCKVLLPNIHTDRLVLPRFPPTLPPKKEMKRKRRRRQVMQPQCRCAAAQQPGAGWQGNATGLLVFRSSRGTAPAAQGTEQSQLP